MNYVQVVDKERNPAAEIHLGSDGKLVVETENETLRTGLVFLVEKVSQEGIQTQVGKRVKRGDSTIFVEQLVTYEVGKAGFMPALARLISRSRFGEQRFFGLVKKEPQETSLPPAENLQ